jgi:hypothetical protein
MASSFLVFLESRITLGFYINVSNSMLWTTEESIFVEGIDRLMIS